MEALCGFHLQGKSSEVLPSLGERNMRQVTLAEFLAQRFQGLKVETLFDRYEKQSYIHRYVHLRPVVAFHRQQFR